MDLNYIVKREQISLERARASKSLAAREAHKGLARAYGKLLASSSFPHTTLLPEKDPKSLSDEQVVERWEGEGDSNVWPE